jgi:hypothetical protein
MDKTVKWGVFRQRVVTPGNAYRGTNPVVDWVFNPKYGTFDDPVDAKIAWLKDNEPDLDTADRDYAVKYFDHNARGTMPLAKVKRI